MAQRILFFKPKSGAGEYRHIMLECAAKSKTFIYPKLKTSEGLVAWTDMSVSLWKRTDNGLTKDKQKLLAWLHGAREVGVRRIGSSDLWLCWCIPSKA